MDSSEIPRIWRRLLCMVYEALLLFGVTFIAVWIFSILIPRTQNQYLQHALQAWLFIVIGGYFVWLWSHGGQTLAMKTWKIRVELTDGKPLQSRQAITRYLLAWGWFLPGLILAWAGGVKGGMLLTLPMLNLAAWVLTAYLDPHRQFLHDRLAGTRLVRVPAASNTQASAAI